MARPETLIPGNCYFSVGFYDNDLVLPMIDTLVYVGQGRTRMRDACGCSKSQIAQPRRPGSIV